MLSNEIRVAVYNRVGREEQLTETPEFTPEEMSVMIDAFRAFKNNEPFEMSGDLYERFSKCLRNHIEQERKKGEVNERSKEKS